MNEKELKIIQQTKDELLKVAMDMAAWNVISSCGIPNERIKEIGEELVAYMMEPQVNPEFDTENEEEFNKKMLACHNKLVLGIKAPAEGFVYGYMCAELYNKLIN